MLDSQVVRTNKINIDVHPTDQPKDAHRFALNAVIESKNGDFNVLSTEGANAISATLPTDFKTVGTTYMTDHEVAVLAADSVGNSYIGIFNTESEILTEHVNDSAQSAKLGFSLNNPIEVTYRKRRGCERTIYFAGKGIYPMNFSFDSPTDFQTSSLWVPNKFRIQRIYESVPTFSNIETAEDGSLPAGSYEFAIRLLDSDFNPTEFINSTDTIIIYHDLVTRDFAQANGSTNLKSDLYNYSNTTKSISFELSTLDTNYPYYQIAVLEANAGTGNISAVKLSQVIPIEVETFKYTSDVGFLDITTEEVAQFNSIISSADHIEQIENRLVLANTEGFDVNLCKLQSYASQITASMISKTVVLNAMESVDNPKRPQVHNENLGYMPGEIYSFGISYLLDNYTVTPEYHIPGGAGLTLGNMAADNESDSDVYLNPTGSCDFDYWGVDANAVSLEAAPVRNHRFPTRSAAGLDFVTSLGGGATITTSTVFLDATGPINGSYTGPTDLTLTINYLLDGVPASNIVVIDSTALDIVGEELFTVSGVVTGIAVVETADGGGFFPLLTYGTSVTAGVLDTGNELYTSDIMGISFDNILLPPADTLDGATVIGYYISRHRRDDDNKTIVDTGVLLPTVREELRTDRYVSHGLLMPVPIGGVSLTQKDVLALIHPEHKFHGKEYTSNITYRREGFFELGSGGQRVDTRLVEDAQPGTSYDPARHKARDKDTDGFTLACLARDNQLDYTTDRDSTFIEPADVEQAFYMNALATTTIEDSTAADRDVFNLSTDNKIGFIQTNSQYLDADFLTRLPYVIMEKEVANPYSNFRVLPYYREHTTARLFGGVTQSIDLYSGDTYISSMRYTNSVYVDTETPVRNNKSGFLRTLAGVLVGIASIVAAPITGGASLAGLKLSASLISSGIKIAAANKAYTQDYDAGLKFTLSDTGTGDIFASGTISNDDEIQWFSDTLTNLWFESSVNMNWRVKTTAEVKDFLNSPTGYQENELADYLTNKITTPDPNNNDGLTYQGFSMAELYKINKDYERRRSAKINFHLPLEYDCCSPCREDFGTRIHYSEQAFQEELTDNFRVFLPNNYRDLEGETGNITAIKRMGKDLIIWTEEALWILPQNIEERITSDVISFIGTGSYFSIPPQKVMDDSSGRSAGCTDKWSIVKTPFGVAYASEQQGNFFSFNGQTVKNLSLTGVESYHRENIPFKNVNQKEFLRNAMGQEYACGIISAYDQRFERMIFTKKDWSFEENLITTTNLGDFKLLAYDNDLYVFENYDKEIADKLALNTVFQGVVDNEMIFFNNTTGLIETVAARILTAPELALVQANHITMSYSLKTGGWTSWHDYFPNWYITALTDLFSVKNDSTEDEIWKHNQTGTYLSYYGVTSEFVIEVAIVKSPLDVEIYDNLYWYSEAEVYDSEQETFNDTKVSFTKVIAYNSRQNTGELTLVLKDDDAATYMMSQVSALATNEIRLDRDEDLWRANEFRNYRDDYSKPMFTKLLSDRLANITFTDKVLEPGVIDQTIDWSEREPLRDRYLLVRLTFDNFTNTKLGVHYFISQETKSER